MHEAAEAGGGRKCPGQGAGPLARLEELPHGSGSGKGSQSVLCLWGEGTISTAAVKAPEEGPVLSQSQCESRCTARCPSC